MAIVLRLTKNGALTHEELDGNFTDLNTRTTALENNSANWSTAYTWGNHAAAGYLTFYEETDPVFTDSPAAGITDLNIANWSTAYNWGNHSSAGYLTTISEQNLGSLQDVDFTDNPETNQLLRWNGTAWVASTFAYTETDPVFTQSPAAGIGNTEISNWNTAYGWGDHSTAGYLTSATAVSISDTAPVTAANGDLWWNSSNGLLKIYYNDGTSLQWVDATPQGGSSPSQSSPTAIGCINMNGNNPTWMGTTGYTVSKSGGDGSAQGLDVVYTLTFPSPYSARTDYIVNASYDGTNWTAGNGVQIGTTRFVDKVEFIIRRWNEDPLNLGEIMIIIHDL